MSRARVAVMQFPGLNCESESVLALSRVGLEGEIFRWTRDAGELHDFHAYLIPGGWSYNDRVRGGALAAKDPLLEVLAEEVERGKPVLGICNGAQVLVEAGLVPGGGTIDLALARNRMTARGGYYSRWIYTRVDSSPCVFTRHLPAGTVLPLPVAHGEGRVAARDPEAVTALTRAGLTPLRYASADGKLARKFPDNPNGSLGAVAGLCNQRGNVLAMMPHPERAQVLESLARTVSGTWGERRATLADRGHELEDTPGPGLTIFEGLRRHLEEA
ncbi:MAG: phosphoribosylformylglycinamidine synthase I [Candidatus Eiseniibacteriota bacterium]